MAQAKHLALNVLFVPSSRDSSPSSAWRSSASETIPVTSESGVDCLIGFKWLGLAAYA